MTFEEMKERAKQVADALNASEGFSDAAIMEDVLVEGGPLPVGFVDLEGNDLVVELNVL